jgi:hypothetical protein
MHLASDYIHPAPRGGRCRIRIFLPEEEQDAPVVICSELPNNGGTSLTYAAEQLAAEVIRSHELPNPRSSRIVRIVVADINHDFEILNRKLIGDSNRLFRNEFDGRWEGRRAPLLGRSSLGVRRCGKDDGDNCHHCTCEVPDGGDATERGDSP